ncbi:MAG: CRISPR-associated protein Cas4 [Veillonellaceae bacterium]|jgi:CRISPR-associated exonuclease Cas4|nr:CRISPR-associated protein Cas4 [Veillonellaceae bacterium]
MNVKVTDIKQYIYCPRIIYFLYVCPVNKKTTYKMQAGKEEHFILDKLERRRTLKRYNLESGERVFHAWLNSPRLGLQGKLDLHIISGKDYFPVEFKFTTRGASLNHKYQLISYALLLEDSFKCNIRFGLLYLVPTQTIIPIEITPNSRLFVHEIIDRIREIVKSERMPEKQKKTEKCRDCEYLRFCGDIDFIRKGNKISVFFN